jgi:hypothetical protein
MSNIEKRALEIFNDIVSDIMFVWDNVPREVAEKSALVFIQNPEQLIELSGIVREKKAKVNV